MTFDTHLINVALAGLGISAGIAVLVAIAIIGIAATQLRRKSSGDGKLAAVPASVLAGHPAQPPDRQRAA